MSSTFHRTLRSLDLERPLAVWLRLVFVLVLLSAWGLWLHVARVSVFATSSKARLEVSRMASRVGAPEAGSVALTQLELGREVRLGEVLVELDAGVEQKRLAEQETRAAAIESKLAAVRRQIEAEEDVRRWQGKLAAASISRAEIDVRQREASAVVGEELAAITTLLNDEKVSSTVDLIQARSRGLDERLKAEGARADLGRLSVEHGYDDRRAHAQIVALERSLHELEADRGEALAAVETARAEIERRRIRAPISGKLGSVSPVQIGDVLKAGDSVATIIPPDDVHVVALFAPEDAVGRVLLGQPARMRLDGFAWTQFGMLEGRVAHVASEPSDGAIRVELSVDVESAGRIPMQHGMPGEVEVEVESVSPWSLLVRSVVSR